MSESLKELGERLSVLCLLRFHVSQILEKTDLLLKYCEVKGLNIEQAIVNLLAWLKAIDEEAKAIKEKVERNE